MRTTDNSPLELNTRHYRIEQNKKGVYEVKGFIYRADKPIDENNIYKWESDAQKECGELNNFGKTKYIFITLREFELAGGKLEVGRLIYDHSKNNPKAYDVAENGRHQYLKYQEYVEIECTPIYK